MEMRKKYLMENRVPLLLILAVSLLLAVRSFFSFSWSDESFYLTMVHRFWLGERMFVDEWYTTQLSTPLILPFYTFYQWLMEGNEGIYLYFRLLYCGICGITALFCYLKLRESLSALTALLCTLVYLFYSRANIGGMSYYNMTLTLVLLATILLYSGLKKGKLKGIKLFFVGILLALAVLYTPFLSIPYIAIFGGMLLNQRGRRRWREILTVICATAITAVVYLSYIFSKVELKEILFNIPYVLNEPELQKTNPFLAVPVIFLRIAWRYKWTIIPYISIFIMVFYKNRKKEKLSVKQNKWILIANIIIFSVNYYLSRDMIGCVNIALVLLGGIVLYTYYENEDKERITLLTFGLAGISMVFAFTFSSDTGLDAMTIGFVPLAMMCIILMLQNKKIKSKKIVYQMMVSVVLFVILQTAELRLVSVYRDAPLNQLDTMITSGPAKYLYTTKEHEEQYITLKEDILQNVREDDKVFFSKNCFWTYLCVENEYGVPSSWRVGLDSPRLEEYFSLNPEKIPTCVFVVKPEYGSFQSSMIQNNEKADRPNENKTEGFLYEYMMENNYEIIETESAIVYRKKNLN